MLTAWTHFMQESVFRAVRRDRASHINMLLGSTRGGRDGPGEPCRRCSDVELSNAEDGCDRRPSTTSVRSLRTCSRRRDLGHGRQDLALDGMTGLITARLAADRRPAKLPTNEAVVAPPTSPWRWFDIGSVPARCAMES
ncbi:hypothetical protein C8035_v009297 [Colletotrichum spinosum]|uniref:Uncharacterized protein n=1 Tax=Colletotrichum spinosum TaxID=1347390 RepID=A0A4R8Q9Y3_9PEZI|nr:hypothetical protein C8035_v009297 [Colletotrichum spinosum]